MSAMNSLVCTISFAAVLALAGGQQGIMKQTRSMKMKGDCWPSNQTRARCFASLPSDTGPLPSESNDSYSGIEGQGFDFVDYTVVKVKRDPTRFCQYKDKLVEAVTCMGTAMKAKNCSGMHGGEMMSHRDRMQMAVNRYCSRTDKIDRMCMKERMGMVSMCKKDVKDMMKKLRGRNDSSKPMKKNQMEPESESEPKPESESEPKPEAESEPKPEAESAMEPKPESEPGSSGRMGEIVCLFKYKMMRCVKRSMAACHGPTAEIVADFMTDMSSSSCAATMDQWASQEKLSGCDDGVCDGASGLSVAMVTLLLPASLVLGFLAR